MKKYLLLLISLIAILIVAVPYFKRHEQSAKQTIDIGNKVSLKIDVADTEIKRSQGYSNHVPIGFDTGLLFIFDQADTYPFWMNEMLFDLDFIMIKDNKISELVEKIKAPVNNNSKIEYVIPKLPFNQLLEVKAGFIEKYQIEVGDSIKTKF